MRVLGVDPGGMNGLAWFNDAYEFEGFAQVKLDDLPIWLNEHKPKPDVVILENYKLWKHKALQQSGSTMPASQGIGMVKSYCKVNGIKLVEQSPQILQTAVLMTGMPLPKDHSQSHWVSAFNHAKWWMIQEGYAQVVIAEEDK